MELRLGSSGKKDAEDEPTKGNLAGGCCFDFNKVSACSYSACSYSACSYSDDDCASPRTRHSGLISVVLLPICHALYCNGPIVLQCSHACQQAISVTGNSMLLVKFATVCLM